MYKILKEKGNNQNIMIENTDTGSSIIIGKLNMSIMKELEKELRFDETRADAIKLKDKWDFDISDDLAKGIMSVASPIRKPIRAKTKTVSSTSNTSNTNTSEQSEIIKPKITKTGRAVVDVFDLIYGTTE